MYLLQDTLTGYIEQNQIKPTVEKVYPFEDFIGMYQHSMAGHTVGKVVLRIGAPVDEDDQKE